MNEKLRLWNDWIIQLALQVHLDVYLGLSLFKHWVMSFSMEWQHHLLYWYQFLFSCSLHIINWAQFAPPPRAHYRKICYVSCKIRKSTPASRLVSRDSALKHREPQLIKLYCLWRYLPENMFKVVASNNEPSFPAWSFNLERERQNL